MAKRIGSKMAWAARIVAASPGCSIRRVAEIITPCPNPSSNWAYGYAPVHRAIKAGLIVASAGKGNAYSLTVPTR